MPVLARVLPCRRVGLLPQAVSVRGPARTRRAGPPPRRGVPELPAIDPPRFPARAGPGLLHGHGARRAHRRLRPARRRARPVGNRPRQDGRRRGSPGPRRRPRVLAGHGGRRRLASPPAAPHQRGRLAVHARTDGHAGRVRGVRRVRPGSGRPAAGAGRLQHLPEPLHLEGSRRRAEGGCPGNAPLRRGVSRRSPARRQRPGSSSGPRADVSQATACVSLAECPHLRT